METEHLTFFKRSAQMNDLESLVNLSNQCSYALIGKPDCTDKLLTHNWQTPGFHVETDVYTIWTSNNNLVGSIEIYRLNEAATFHWLHLRVHPMYIEHDVAKELLCWAEQHIYECIASFNQEDMVVAETELLSTQTVLATVLNQYGYQPVRHSWVMLIDLDQPIPEPVIPERIIIRPYHPETELEALAQADLDAFRDHWGYIEHSIEFNVEQWSHWRKEATYDPALWFVAMNGDEIAGFAACYSQTDEDPKMGWIDSIAVRPAWRKQGLGLALLQHAFGVFQQRGQTQVGLGVDTENLTGATRLYQRAGMYVDRQYTTYQKVLRPGVDIRTR